MRSDVKRSGRLVRPFSLVALEMMALRGVVLTHVPVAADLVLACFALMGRLTGCLCVRLIQTWKR